MEPGVRTGRLAVMSGLATAARRRGLGALLLTLLIAGALAACGPASPSVTRSAVPSTLAGTAWTAVLVDGQPTVTGTRPAASFTTDQVKGTTGCNSYGGPYQYSAGTIAFGDLATTLVGCQGAVGAVEQRFVKALDGATTVSMDPDGRLIIDGSGGSITLEVSAQPSAS